MKKQGFLFASLALAAALLFSSCPGPNDPDDTPPDTAQYGVSHNVAGGSHVFGAKVTGYDEAPAALEVTVSNTGTKRYRCIWNLVKRFGL